MVIMERKDTRRQAGEGGWFGPGAKQLASCGSGSPSAAEHRVRSGWPLFRPLSDAIPSKRADCPLAPPANHNKHTQNRACRPTETPPPSGSGWFRHQSLPVLRVTGPETGRKVNKTVADTGANSRCCCACAVLRGGGVLDSSAHKTAVSHLIDSPEGGALNTCRPDVYTPLFFSLT